MRKPHHARLAALAASAGLAVMASANMAAAQTRTFACPKHGSITVTVTGPDSVSAGPIEGKTLRMRKNPQDPMHFLFGDYGVKIAPTQSEITLEIPDWGTEKCAFGAQAAAAPPGQPVATGDPGDFPVEAQSLGGIVRAFPAQSAVRIASLTEGTPVVIMARSEEMDGYSWFKISFNGRTGYQWGGIMCSRNPLNGILKQCDRP